MAQSKFSIGETEHQDKITIYWTIPNFKALYDACKTAKKIIIIEEKFTIGGKNWGFSLQQEKIEDVRIFLNFYGPDCAIAEYSGYLKSSEGEFIRAVNVGLCKYAPEGSHVEGASSGWGYSSCKTLSGLERHGFLSDDDGSLDFKLLVSVYTQNAHNVSTDFKNGLDSAVGSDVTFFFQEEGSQIVIGEIKAHRGILSIRSSVFAAMFASGMKEVEEGKVWICDMTPKAFKILLKYIYSGEVDEEWSSVADELIYGADKYNLAELQKYLYGNLESVLTVKNVLKIRNVARLYNLSEVKESTVKFIHNNTKEFLEELDVALQDL